MVELVVKVGNVGGWNTVNKRRAELLLKNCVFSCKGHYTDDYAYDAEVNYDRDLSSEQCVKSIREDLKGGMDCIKIFWDDAKKVFIFFYGQWLIYQAVPLESFKVVREVVKDSFNIPYKVQELQLAMQERTDLYFSANFQNLEPDEVTVKNRRKYFAIDVGSSGKLLVDKKNLAVYSIKGYGVKGYWLGSIEQVIDKVKDDIFVLQKVKQEGKKVYALRNL